MLQPESYLTSISPLVETLCTETLMAPLFWLLRIWMHCIMIFIPVPVLSDYCSTDNCHHYPLSLYTDTVSGGIWTQRLRSPSFVQRMLHHFQPNLNIRTESYLFATSFLSSVPNEWNWPKNWRSDYYISYKISPLPRLRTRRNRQHSDCDAPVFTVATKALLFFIFRPPSPLFSTLKMKQGQARLRISPDWSV